MIPTCPYCSSNKVIKHGRTTTGNTRFRCRNCGKTWVLEKSETIRPDLSEIVESYLGGSTCRELVSVYKSSPLRINQKIREFLEGCPRWEDYIDACLDIHEPRLIYLIGRNFSCACKANKNNSMFLAMAIDALSNVVLGFQIDIRETKSLWSQLLSDLRTRGFICKTFMANGSKLIEEAVQSIFSESSLRIFYHRAYHDKELLCCLSHLPVNQKLINDAIRTYDSIKNKNLNFYLHNLNESKLKDFLIKNPELFSKRLKERFDNKPKIRLEGLISDFQTRFQKFHMVKDDPYPLINGWIARWMLQQLHSGFSRLSYYIQIPSETTFKNFSCGQIPVQIDLSENSPLLQSFVLDVAARAVQLPLYYSSCEMKLDKCILY
jgi:transposase-like protein